MSSERNISAGFWHDPVAAPAFSNAPLVAAIERVREPAHVIRHPQTGALGVAVGGSVSLDPAPGGRPAWPIYGSLPPLYPEWLGDRSFAETHAVRFPYVTGAMANGIATTRLVRAIGGAGGLGFFGAAGLAYGRVEQAVAELVSELGTGAQERAAWGCNLIHSPQEPALEAAVAELFIERGVRRVSAAAFMSLTPAIVRYAVAGLSVDPQGRIVRPRQVFAKISRLEVARHFFEPAPAKMLSALVESGQISARDAELAAHVPIAEDITVESDSGGHTDNRPLAALLPSVIRLRDEIVAARGYARPIRVGAAGGIGTPSAVASAFALGAAYIVTGSVNQACIESGTVMSPAASTCSPTAGIWPTWSWHRLRTCSNSASRSRSCVAGPCSGSGPRSSTTCTAPTGPGPRSPPKSSARSRPSCCARATPRPGRAPRRFGSSATPKRSPRPRPIRATSSRSCSARTWASRAAGRSSARPSAAVTFRSGVAPPWAPSTAGRPGASWPHRPRRGVVQVARNLLEGAAVITRAQQLRSYGVSVPAAALIFVPARSLDPEHATMTTSIQKRPPLAVVGVSALFPGSIDASGFWTDILAGRDLLTDVARDALVARGLLRRRPEGARQDLRQARGLLVPRRLRSHGLGRPAEHHQGHGHLPAARLIVAGASLA